METWKDTAAALRQRIAQMYPDWSDHNLHDPGITILELLAWMQQNQIYHAEQIGQSHRLKYADLLGVSRRKRCPGRTFVTVKTGQALYLEAGTGFYADTIRFETRKGQMVLEGAIKRLRTLGGEPDTALEGSWMEEGRGISLLPFGRYPQTGNCLEITLREELSPGKRHRLFMKTGPEQHILDGAFGPLNPVDETAYDGHGYYPLAEVRMEYRTEQGWMAADVEEDDTYGLVQDGSICFFLRSPMKQGDWRIRFRLERSDYLWPPCITRISLAMVEVWQQETVREPLEFFGRGLPEQRFDCGMRDLCREYMTVETSMEEDLGQIIRWQQAEDFSRSGAEDRHYRVEKGWILFGDGFSGRMPEGIIRVGGILRTLGKAGNVKAGAIDRMEGESPVSVFNEEEVSGGADEETADEVFGRFLAGVDRKRRAVLPEDYQELVMGIPGLLLDSCVVFAGDREKRELVVAAKPAAPDGQGQLNEACRKNLYRYLEEKRLLGTRLLIRSPEYCPVSIVCRLSVKPQYRNGGRLTEDWIREWMGKRGFGQGISYGELTGSLESLPWILEVHTLSIINGRQGRRNVNGDLLLSPDGLMVLRQVACQVMAGMGRE